ncbi:MAG: hypothetical protein K0Q59_4947, partial [Paenibacillus sp.]|nr:hypothetical protein [Paenibacillus sp.]
MTMNQKVAVGYVGCGVMGRVYMRAAEALPFVVSKGVTDLNREAAQKAADDFGIGSVYDDVEAMFSDPGIDAVILALPAQARAGLAIRAFQAGKHVLIEKPAAMNAEEVRLMIEARGDRIAGCCSARLRCQDSADQVRKVIASGRLGEIRVIRSCWQTIAKAKGDAPPPLWRLSRSVNGGGNLANLGSYALDYVLGMTGWELEPDQVLARTWNVPDRFRDHVAPGSDAETLTTALVTFKSGPVLMLDQGEFYVGAKQTAWQISGESGTLSFCILPTSQVIVLHEYRDGQIQEEIVWEGVENFAEMQ